MAVSLTIMNAMNFVTPILKNQRLNITNQEPGLTMANIVLQRMLGAPFVWRFNRDHIEFLISKLNGTDYQSNIVDLGRIEAQWLTDQAGTTIFELQGATALAKVSSTRRPMTVAPQFDDNQGNITFRFNSIPDKSYIANFDYQRKARLLQSYGEDFGPVPDEFGYLFNKGLLAEGALIVNDARFPIWEKDFIAGLLATQDGLDAQAKAIFYEQMLNTGRTASRSQGASQSGIAGRQQ
jgi:hypothetical protein